MSDGSFMIMSLRCCSIHATYSLRCVVILNREPAGQCLSFTRCEADSHGIPLVTLGLVSCRAVHQSVAIDDPLSKGREPACVAEWMWVFS
jgi:hypothetical protein